MYQKHKTRQLCGWSFLGVFGICLLRLGCNNNRGNGRGLVFEIVDVRICCETVVELIMTSVLLLLL